MIAYTVGFLAGAATVALAGWGSGGEGRHFIILLGVGAAWWLAIGSVFSGG